MSKQTRAADYGGATGLYIPENVTENIVNDIYSCAVLPEVSNPDFDFINLGLDHAFSVRYHLVDDVDLMIPTRHQLNGEFIEIPSPFRSGVIEMCHEIAIDKKYSRNEAIQLGSYWETNQYYVEQQIARNLTKVVETFTFQNVAASVRPENQGNNAGLSGGKIYLGDSNKPLSVTIRNDDSMEDFRVTASEVVNRLSLTFSLSGSSCPQNKLRVVASPSFVSKLRSEQARMMSGGSCCIDDKPAISGILSNSWGFPILESMNLPVHYMADGTRIEYVLLINPEMVAAPMNLDYLEWQTILRDIHLIGNFRFGSHLLSGKGAAVAAVKFS